MPAEPWRLAVLALVLAVSVAWDLRRREIPDWLTKPSMALGFAGILLWAPGLREFLLAWLSVLTAFLLGLWLFRSGYWGGGDLKLFVAYASLLPQVQALLIFALSLFLHLLLMLPAAARMRASGREVTMGTKIPLPYALSLGLAALLLASLKA
jgi:Flp pilus assembly protein protease CpaA